jgi:hypothetical protein
MIKPDVSYDIITEVIAPGPTRRGKARGTAPVSSAVSPIANLHEPCVNSSIDRIKSRIPPAIMKLNILILNIDSIRVPPTANRSVKKQL